MRTATSSIFTLITTLIFCCVSCVFAPGSYPYAELYEFQVSEDSLIRIVEKFKDENPKYSLHEQERFVDGRKSEGKQWYHVWFYYPQENQVIKCWIRTSDKGYAEFGFVGIGNGLTLSDYKEINKDFSKQENRFQKDKFERLILNEIKKLIK
jgi:hypothetical protein